MGRQVYIATPAQAGPLRERVAQPQERAARRTLREQIARLEGELAEAFVTAFPMGGLDRPPAVISQPRLLDLGELERVRDELASRLHAARVTIARRADEQEDKRRLLERMLLDPGSYRFVRISRSEIGEPGCGAWQVRPRLGLVGMLMGWWQVKLSSGCPLAGGRGTPAARQRPLGDLMRVLLRNGAGAVLVVLIMFIGSFCLWVGTPLLWLWVGSQIQGATESLGLALLAMLVGVVITVTFLASVLATLSEVYRANCISRGRDDPGHVVLEAVLVVSAGLTLAAFVIWFFLLAGANPVPIGIQI
ncbi:MAG: hypothetical protein ACLPV4_18770 [Solirubrobacteraceae bacterium]